MTPRLPAALASALVLALLAPPASAQLRLASGPDAVTSVHYVCALYDRGGTVEPGPVLDLSAVETARRGATYARVESRRRQATLVVDYSGAFTAEAQAAFQRAVDIWGDHLTSSAPIRIRADFEALDTNVLGQAGPAIVRAQESAGVNTWYPFALADAIEGRDLFPAANGDSNYDIEAVFSSAFPRFYFGLDGNPPSNQIDFTTVVLHELGHGLGFIGSGSVDDGDEDLECTGVGGIGCVGVQGRDGLVSPLIFDRFLNDSAGEAILDTTVYPNNSEVLGDLLQSEALFVDAPNVVEIYDGPTPIWAPAEFEPGSSFSHWDEVVIQGSSAALMTPALASGEAYLDPGDITCAFLADMGWALGDGCSALIGTLPPPPQPTTDVLAVERTGPNPFWDETTYRILLPEEGLLRVVLYDAIGRRIAVLFDGPAGFDETVRVRADDLAAGAYRLVIQTPTDEAVVSLTAVR